MPSIIQSYEYDIFISYRQKDNKQDGWVTEFINSLRNEIEATFKEDISIYFDENPYDGLGETHDVDDSLAKKLKCLIFIPIISKTYCDPNSFAWTNEFLAFNKLAANDEHGIKVTLPNGNTASRVLPIKIHDIDDADKKLVEDEIGFLRSIDFVYQSAGVNRPLRPKDDDVLKDASQTFYRDQINKVANAIQEIITGLKNAGTESTEKEVSRSTSTTAAPSVENKPKGKSKVLMASIGVILILALVYFFYNKIDSGAIEEEIDKSIAVLPFTDMSQGGDQQYFADGVMEDILTQLQRMGELRVTSRTSVERYRDTDKSAPEIGDELNVSYLLEGSVRKAEDQIMITAQLINTGSDSHIWADNFTSEYTAKGLFDIQRKIAENIVGELQLQISPEKVNEITQAPTDNTHAYELYQRAFSHYSQINKKDNDLAINISKQAILADPKYSEAYGLLANAYSLNAINFAVPGNWFDSAEYYASQGILLNTNCSKCYRALAKVQRSKYGNLEKGFEYEEKAMKINPNDLMIYFTLTNSSYYLGKWEKALQYLTRLNRLETNVENIYNMTWLYFNVGDLVKSKDYAEKIRALDQQYLITPPETIRLAFIFLIIQDSTGFNNSIQVLMDKNPLDGNTHFKIMGNYWLEKKYEKLIEYYEDIGYSDWMYMMIPYCYWKLGFKDKAELASKNILDNFVSKEGNLYPLYTSLKSLYNDQVDQSLDRLDKAIELNYLGNISSDILYESLYDNPRFQELVEKQKKKREEVMALVATYNFPEPEDL